MRRLEMTEARKAVGMNLTAMINYSARTADYDLTRLTGGYYHLDGYTGKYEIVTCDGKVVLHQKTAKLTLRDLVIVAIEFFEDCEKGEGL